MATTNDEKTWEELSPLDRRCDRTIRIIGPDIDDDGVVFRAERGGRLLEHGIAMHEGRGQADTIRRALRDLFARCREARS